MIKINKFISQFLNILMVLFFNFIGVLGAFMVVYSWLVFFTDTPWQVFLIIEPVIITMGNYFTIIGTILVALSIYLPENKRKPEKMSKLGTAPIVIASALLSTILLLCFHFKPNSLIFNGFSLLAISGSLFRTFSRWNINKE